MRCMLKLSASLVAQDGVDECIVRVCQLQFYFCRKFLRVFILFLGKMVYFFRKMVFRGMDRHWHVKIPS